jgi:beta-glucanase (GH16 family)
MKYGRLEVKAQLPKGDWLWPAIWMIPVNNEYGQWPASGEIDIVESRGNPGSCDLGGRNSFGSTLHWGPGYPFDAWEKAHAEYTHPTDLSDDFHLYGLEWTEEYIKTTIDGKEVLNFPFDQDMFTKGGFDQNLENPWKYETEKSAPFNKEMFLVFNVAAGGTGGYFPDGHCDKPWDNTDPHAPNQFYDKKDTWYKTWNYPASHDSAMKIDYVKVWENDGQAEPTFLQ